MLEALRNASKGWIAKIFLGLLILSFAVWGIADIFTGFGSRSLASVGKTEIDPQAFSREYSRTLQLFSTQLGQKMTMERAREIGLDRGVLNDLLRTAAVEEQARLLSLAVSTDTIREEVMANPAFRDSAGKFDPVRFRGFLDANGQNEASYFARETGDRLREAITGAVSKSAPVPLALAEAGFRHQNEQRDARYFAIKVTEADLPALPEADIKAHYEANPKSFTAPEYRNFTLIKAEPDDILAQISVTDEEARKLYDKDPKAYFIEEQREVSQITFPSKADAQAARDRIAKGDDFLAIAKERGFSDTDVVIGSGARQSFIDDTIAEAAFKLQDGAVSEVVEAKLSTVLLKVKVVNAEHQQSFEEAKAAVIERIKRDKAHGELRVIFDAVEDARSQQTSFDDIAARANLPVIKVDGVDAQGLDRAGKLVTIPQSEQVLPQVFATDAGLDVDAISTAGGGFIWLTVREVAPAAVRPFETVKDQAKASLTAERLRGLALEKARALAERGKAGAKLEDLAKEAGAEVKTVQGLKRNETSGDFDTEAVNALFSVPEGGFAAAPDGDGRGARIMQSQAVLLGGFAPDSAEAKALADTLAKDLGEDLQNQYLRSLEAHIGVSVNEAMWRQITGAANP